jgi:hypothetical protein
VCVCVCVCCTMCVCMCVLYNVCVWCTMCVCIVQCVCICVCCTMCVCDVQCVCVYSRMCVCVCLKVLILQSAKIPTFKLWILSEVGTICRLFTKQETIKNGGPELFHTPPLAWDVIWFFPFIRVSQNCEKRLLTSPCLSVRPSNRMKHLDFHLTDFL